MYDYICNVCNFLNNTEGYITEVQVKFLIEYVNKATYTWKKFFENVKAKDLLDLSELVENDKQNDFYEKLYFLSKKFI